MPSERPTSSRTRDPAVGSQPDLPKLEQEILDFWQADGTFKASIDQRPAGENGSNEYVFYDGPPFANGLPHYGHLLTGYIKDAVPRYQTMRGHRVERRFGWDCHGLPAEVEAEKELGISTRAEILEMGIDKFNRACKLSVLRYTEQWQQYVTRQARWVDFENEYKTLDLSYMESVMGVFKSLYDRGLIYEGYKVLPYCWECETSLSHSETRLDDAYRDRQDPAVTVLFSLEDGREILVWTTTPWTLPSNLALAVGPDIDYAVYTEGDRTFLIGEATAAKYEAQLADATLTGTVKGSTLVGLRYAPLFDYFADQPNAFQVLSGDFVNTDEGTGTVHMAPGFGEDDQLLCQEHGIAVVVPVDSRGRFTADVPDYEGVQVFAANQKIIRDLKERGAVVRSDSYVHSYPHCWRTETPLIYKASGSWFVKVTAVRDRAMELNQEINWVPSNVRDGAFGSWLGNARDWAISRSRFWGSPLPVWKSDDPRYPRMDVYGSLDELERDFGVRPDDLHRPGIDQLTRPNPDDPTGASTMRRIDDVLDCWFESGSMPYAQVHYPMENREWFEDHFPADFIVEYVGQTRAWFYYLHVLATALFDRPAFRNCMVHGIILGNDGRKMSKSLRNYPDPVEMFDKYGADPMRWFLLSSAIVRGADVVATEEAVVDAVRQAVHPLWNVWYFFTLYANADGYEAQWRTDAPGVLDRYLLAKTHDLVVDVADRMDNYDTFAACASIRSFVDALSNWYIRRSRDRIYAGDHDAFDTLYTALETLCRVAAPLLPLVTESIWRDLTNGRSVHLTDWPDAATLPADPELVAAMDLARDVCSAASSVRKAAGKRVRLPLSTLTVASADASALAPFTDLIAEELNVKNVELLNEVGELGAETFTVVPAVVGPRIGKDVQKVLAAARAGEWVHDATAGTLTLAGHTLTDGEFTHTLKPADESTTRALAGDGGLVALDLAVTPELEAEGLARDVARMVNEARRDAGLDVTDRIHLVLDLPDDVRAAVDTHTDYVAAQSLAVDVVLAGPITNARRYELPDGRAVHIGLSKRP